jgi:hypothetical protein
LAGDFPIPFISGMALRWDDWPLPPLMVSRIDALTMPHARRMIDQAIETETRGLWGNMYVDARGMKKGRPLSYGYYDADLQDFANTFRRATSFPSALENTEQPFNKPRKP